MRTREADESQELERPAGHIARARVQHGFMVSKGNLVQNGLVIVHVKSPPAAIVALHAEEPLQTTLQDFALFLIGEPGFVQRNQHCHSVIIIRIKIVVKLKGPSPGLSTPVLDLPIPFPEHLLAHHPLHRLAHIGMRARQARVSQGDNGEHRIPHR